MERVVEIPKLPMRRPESNKGDFGRVLIVGGSRNMPGAPALAALAALRSGAGLVTVAVPRSIQQTVVSLVPCATSIALAEDEDGLISEQAAHDLSKLILEQKKFDVVAVGPGLGKAPVGSLIQDLNRNKIPNVIDADGLNILAGTDWHGQLSGPCVITPHPGELARLLGLTVSEIQSNREYQAQHAVSLMRKNSGTKAAVALLKGIGTVVTDGEQIYINTTGNPGMATGGSGDILTGIIAALIGQKLSPFQAAVLGAYIHGRAGDLAAKQLGEISLIASDLVDFLSVAFQQTCSFNSQ
jgi:ADP-dependent NAD(P)H-hydrate dehydratase